MDGLPRELMGDAPIVGRSEPRKSIHKPKCARCDSELDDGFCPTCVEASLDERILAAQEGRDPEEWSLREQQQHASSPSVPWQQMQDLIDQLILDESRRIYKQKRKFDFKVEINTNEDNDA